MIQAIRGGGWPIERVTEELNLVDLVWHELEFREGTSFTTRSTTRLAAIAAAAVLSLAESGHSGVTA
jgi:hypothetical protein